MMSKEEELLQTVGDSIANVLEQLEKGNWVDDHGHDVRYNMSIVKLAVALVKIAKYREQELDYSAWDGPEPMEEEEY